MSEVLSDIENLIRENFSEFINENNNEVDIIKPIDSGAIQLLSDLVNASLKFNPLHVEPLIDESMQYLARCLEQQALAQELEYQAITTVLEHELSINSLKKEEESVVLRNNFEFGAKEIGRQSTISRQGNQSKGTDESIEAIKLFDESINNIQLGKISARKNYLNKLKGLRGQEGSALNLVERFNNAKEIFEIELRELYLRLRSIEKGISEVFGIDDLPLPQVINSGYLKEIQKYLLEVTNRVNGIVQYDQEFVLVLPLSVGYYKNNEHIKFYEDAADFKNQISGGELRFTIPDQILEDFKNCRLKGIKISVRWDKAVNTSDRWSFDVKVPEQRDTDGNLIWDVPQYRVVGLMANNPGYIYSNIRDLSLYNASIEGEWEIKLPKKSSRNNSLTHADMNDIFVELLITTRVI